MLRHFLLLSLAASTVAGLSCYGYDDYFAVVETVHHRKFCTAIYEVSDGSGSFGGGERHPSRIPNIVSMPKGNDCVLQHVESNLKGVPSSDIWMCYCFENMCNYPSLGRNSWTVATLSSQSMDWKIIECFLALQPNSRYFSLF